MSDFDKREDENIDNLNEGNHKDDFLNYDNIESDESKKKKGSNKAISGTIAVALTASLIGGGIGGFGVYSAMNDSNDDSVKVSKEKESDKDVTIPGFKTEETMTTAEAVEKVTPAVVGVSTKSIVIDQYFKNPTEQEGIGSGFIISEDGLIVTNYHVVKGAQEVKVILSDGTEVDAKVVNYDEKADLAVIDITSDIKMPGVANLGDSDALKAGQDVIAIGNPLGKEFSKTVTKGIVSSPNRQLSMSGGDEEEATTFIQTDAAINPGNSGGPLINARGEVIGVNTAKKVGEEIEGIGFSIPINTVKDKLDQLSKPTLVIGITAHNITPEIAAERNIPEGARIKSIADFSPAEKAGLRIGDIITAYNGTPIKSVDELNSLKTNSNEGDIIKLTVFRDGKTIQVDLRLETY